jgi:hypothetical protein
VLRPNNTDCRRATFGAAAGTLHCAQHIFQETGRTIRDLLTTSSSEMLKAIDAIAPIPS